MSVGGCTITVGLGGSVMTGRSPSLMDLLKLIIITQAEVLMHSYEVYMKQNVETDI